MILTSTSYTDPFFFFHSFIEVQFSIEDSHSYSCFRVCLVSVNDINSIPESVQEECLLLFLFVVVNLLENS